MSYRSVVFVMILAGITIAASSATASSPIDKESALELDFSTLVEEAQQAFQAGDFEATIEYLVLAERTDSEPRLLLNIARSYGELGECRLSLAYYEAFLDNPGDDTDLVAQTESTLENAREDCEEYHDELGGRIYFDSEPRLAEVFLDDESLGLTPIETAGLEPGTHRVRIELDGYRDYTAELEVTPDEELMEMNADLELDQVGSENDIDGEDSVGDPPEDPDGGGTEFTLNPVALGLGGGGAVALIAGGLIDLVVIPGVDEQRRSAGEEGNSERVDELTSTRYRWAIGAISGYVAGGLLSTVGVGWILWDYYQHQNSAAGEDPYGWRIAPQFDTDGAGVMFHRRF